MRTSYVEDNKKKVRDLLEEGVEPLFVGSISKSSMKDLSEKLDAAGYTHKVIDKTLKLLPEDKMLYVFDVCREPKNSDIIFNERSGETYSPLSLFWFDPKNPTLPASSIVIPFGKTKMHAKASKKEVSLGKHKSYMFHDEFVLYGTSDWWSTNDSDLGCARWTYVNILYDAKFKRFISKKYKTYLTDKQAVDATADRKYPAIPSVMGDRNTLIRTRNIVRRYLDADDGSIKLFHTGKLREDFVYKTAHFDFLCGKNEGTSRTKWYSCLSKNHPFGRLVFITENNETVGKYDEYIPTLIGLRGDDEVTALILTSTDKDKLTYNSINFDWESPDASIPIVDFENT